MDNLELKTDVWLEYERGKNYNSSRGIYDDYDKFFKFYHGNQWEGLKSGNVQPLVFNIIKPTVKYKVGVLKTYEYQIVFNPNTWENLQQEKALEGICKGLNKFSNRVWEIEQVKAKIDEAIKDCCISGEGVIHSYEEDGNVKVEVIDQPNIYYGNENDESIQDQPYIIISYRRTVQDVKAEAERNGISAEEIENITSDSEYNEQAGKENRNQEISPMCLVLTKYYKQDGQVWVKKCTRTATIVPDQNTKLTLYPIAHMLWEKEKGSARGMGEVKYLIPNQIELNKVATRRAISTLLGAFPRLVYNSKYVKDISALGKVGASIKVDEMSADDIHKVISYLNPTNMSPDSLQLQEDLIAKSQDLAGAGDNVTGNIDPTKTSGKAILAVQQASQQPLNEQLSTLKFFIEDIANIWYDMLKTYSTEGIVVTEEIQDPTSGQKTEQPIPISQEQLVAFKVHIKVDITPRGAYDKFAQEQSLENLLGAQMITFEEYVEALDDDSTMPKLKLIKILEKREEKRKQMQLMQIQANQVQGAMEEALMLQEQNGQQIQNMADQAQTINDNFMGGDIDAMQQM